MSYLARSLGSGDIKKNEEKGGSYSLLMETDIPTPARKINMRWLRYLCWGLVAITLLFIVLCVMGYHYSQNVVYCGTENGEDGDQNGIIKHGASGAIARVSVRLWKWSQGVIKSVFVEFVAGTVVSGAWVWFQGLFSRKDA